MLYALYVPFHNFVRYRYFPDNYWIYSPNIWIIGAWEGFSRAWYWLLSILAIFLPWFQFAVAVVLILFLFRLIASLVYDVFGDPSFSKRSFSWCIGSFESCVWKSSEISEQWEGWLQNTFPWYRQTNGLSVSVTCSSIRFVKTIFMQLSILNITIGPLWNRRFVVSMTMVDSFSLVRCLNGHVSMSPGGYDSGRPVNYRIVTSTRDALEEMHGFGELSPKQKLSWNSFLTRNTGTKRDFCNCSRTLIPGLVH